jgi:hypothetical protein
MNVARPWSRAGVIIGCFLVVGALAGVLWHAWSTPPVGVAVHGKWYADFSKPDSAFADPAHYVAIAVPTGVVLGALFGWLRGSETWTLAAVVLGSVAAAFTMFFVGNALGPPDPTVVSATAGDFTEVPGDLVLNAEPGVPAWWSTALVSLPGGALAGLSVVFLVVGVERRTTTSYSVAAK